MSSPDAPGGGSTTLMNGPSASGNCIRISTRSGVLPLVKGTVNVIPSL